MSTTVGGLVDRVFREYLEPMDDLVSYTTLNTGVNDSITTVVLMVICYLLKKKML